MKRFGLFLVGVGVCGFLVGCASGQWSPGARAMVGQNMIRQAQRPMPQLPTMGRSPVPSMGQSYGTITHPDGRQSTYSGWRY